MECSAFVSEKSIAIVLLSFMPKVVLFRFLNFCMKCPQKYLIMGIFHFNLHTLLKNVPKINVGRKGRFFRLTFLSISPTSFFLRWWIVRLELNHYATSWYDSIFGKRRQVLFFFMIYPNYRNTILDVTLLLLPLREVKIRPNLENCRKKVTLQRAVASSDGFLRSLFSVN